MSTVGQLALVPMIGTQGVKGKTIEVSLNQYEIMDGLQKLGYVVSNIDNPPINLIVRVNAEDATEIKRQVEALLGRPCRDLSMPPAISLRTIRRASAIVGADAVPYEIEETGPLPGEEDEDYDE